MGDALEMLLDHAARMDDDLYYGEYVEVSSAEGIVKKVYTKEGQGKKGPWALDNLLIDENGDENWYGLGFRDDASVPPKVKEGDYVTFDWEQDGQYKNIVKRTARIKKSAPESTSGSTRKAPSPQSSGSTQQNIHYQNSRTAAIEVVSILLENDALPVSGAKNKAGQAKRYEEIVASVNKLTVQLFNDLESFRLFDTVADAGEVDMGADGDLPDAEPSSPVGDEDEPL